MRLSNSVLVKCRNCVICTLILSVWQFMAVTASTQADSGDDSQTSNKWLVAPLCKADSVIDAEASGNRKRGKRVSVSENNHWASQAIPTTVQSRGTFMWNIYVHKISLKIFSAKWLAY